MLTFHREGVSSIHVVIDEAGFELLMTKIDQAKQQGHVHLWSPDTGGHDLNLENPYGQRSEAEVVIVWVGE
jgi:hypothetical protein